jgi:hypothetical protein
VTQTFKPGFSVQDMIGIGLDSFEFRGGVGLFPGDPNDSGITAWNIYATSAKSCTDDVKLDPGASAFLAWLAGRSDLTVSAPQPATISGLPAMSVDVQPVAGAKTCEDGNVRLWETNGSDASVGPGGLTRVIALDVGDQVVAFELWGANQDQWLPLAEQVLETVTFTAS